MKSEIIDLTESTLTFATEFRDDSQNNDINTNTNNNNKALCRYLRPSVQTCINHKCNKNAFMCVDSQCYCRKEHLKCMKINTEDLINNLQEKVVSVESLEQCINQRVDEMIDSLSKFREDTISQMRKDFEYFGLNQLEKEFLRDVKSGKQETMTGKKIWEIINAQENQQKVKQSINWTKERLQSQMNSFNQKIQQAAKKVKTKIDACQEKVSNFLQRPRFFNDENANNLSLRTFISSTLESKIVTSVQEIEKLLYFFSPQKLKSIEIIYRASQNEFLTEKFHQKCSNIPHTLILVRTEHDKKIGGYTPIQWGINPGKFIQDSSGKSFVFSLTNGDKFELINKFNSVYHYSDVNKGPHFGNSKDLYICNKANQYDYSHGNINGSYVNTNYDNSSKETLKSFTGNQYNNSNFKVKEWQVWKLQFQNTL